jgi:hypothetical protein
MDKKKAHTEAGLKDKKFDPQNTSVINQRNIAFSVLQEAPRTTVELRDDFGIMMPAARIKELRQLGHIINTIRVTCITPDGVKHNGVAKYVLIQNKPSNTSN